MKKALFTIITLIGFLQISTLSYGQSQAEESFQIRFAPLNLIDPISGVIQFGLEKKINTRWAVSLDYGFRYLRFYDPMNRINYKFSKTKLELKYFFRLKEKSALSGNLPYLAVEGFYFPQKYRKENEYIFRDNTSFRYEYTNVNRQVLVASLKLGMESPLSKRFVIDNYIGLGVRKMTITQETIGETEEPYFTPVDRIYTSRTDWEDGVYYRPHLSLGFKLGYKIKI